MFLAGSVISSITSGLSNSFTYTEKTLSLESWIEEYWALWQSFQEWRKVWVDWEGGGWRTAEGGLGLVLQSQREGTRARVVEGTCIPHISVMHHRCTGCWCRRA